ncbi:hypothetical protein ABTK13_21045, partial [Acinetobacter baumannii]
LAMQLLPSKSRKQMQVGLAWLSMASGALKMMEFTVESSLLDGRVKQELERISAAEVLVADGQLEQCEPLLPNRAVTVPDWHFDQPSSE